MLYFYETIRAIIAGVALIGAGYLFTKGVTDGLKNDKIKEFLGKIFKR